MRIAFLLGFIASKALSAPLALDYVGKGKPWLIDRASKSPKDAKTMELFHGRKNPWVVFKGEEVKTIKDATSQFKGSQIVGEKSPIKALEDPSQRIYNLPDLLDRLHLQARLPEGINIFSGAEGDMRIVVTRPSVLSASSSLGRRVTILNRSDLILIIPNASAVSIEQSESAKAEVYSAHCIPVNGGSFKRASFDGYYLGGSRENAPCQEDGGKVFGYELEGWMPQLLISGKLRKESMGSVFSRWHHFIYSGV